MWLSRLLLGRSALEGSLVDRRLTCLVLPCGALPQMLQGPRPYPATLPRAGQGEAWLRLTAPELTACTVRREAQDGGWLGFLVDGDSLEGTDLGPPECLGVGLGPG